MAGQSCLNITLRLSKFLAKNIAIEKANPQIMALVKEQVNEKSIRAVVLALE